MLGFMEAVLGGHGDRGRYPLNAYPSPLMAFSMLISDANFACPALQVDRWTAKWVPTFAYEFNDDNAPWPAFDAGSQQTLSLVPPRPQVETDSASRHHCAFWAGG